METESMKSQKQPDEQMNRLPGLFRTHELRGHFSDRKRFYHEPAGKHQSGVELFSVYLRGEIDDEEVEELLVDSMIIEPPGSLSCPLCGSDAECFEIVDEHQPAEVLAICRSCGYETHVARR
jgi:hypothetical protein